MDQRAGQPGLDDASSGSEIASGSPRWPPCDDQADSGYRQLRLPVPWPWGLVDFVARVLRPAPGTVRATISFPNCTAQLVRAAGVLPADGKRSVILYMHGGAFLTCGANTHGRLVTALSSSPTARYWSSTTG